MNPPPGTEIIKGTVNLPVEIKIIILLLLVVTMIALIEYDIYYHIKKRGYRITCRQALRLQIIALKTVLKSAIGFLPRFILLWLVMTLPLIGISVSTELSVVFVIDLILTKVRSFPLLGVDIAYLFLFLYAVMILMGYFLGKYGSVYKLSIVYFVRDDVRQYLNKHQDIHMALLAGSITYVFIIIDLLVMLVYAPSPLSKEVVGIIIALLLIEVLPNKKYQNAINLIEKIWRK
jgi:hypothetical protein